MPSKKLKTHFPAGDGPRGTMMSTVLFLMAGGKHVTLPPSSCKKSDTSPSRAHTVVSEQETEQQRFSTTGNMRSSDVVAAERFL